MKPGKALMVQTLLSALHAIIDHPERQDLAISFIDGTGEIANELNDGLALLPGYQAERERIKCKSGFKAITRPGIGRGRCYSPSPARFWRNRC